MKGGGMANQLSQSLLEQKEKEREGDIIIKKIPLLVLKKKKKIKFLCYAIWGGDCIRIERNFGFSIEYFLLSFVCVHAYILRVIRKVWHSRFLYSSETTWTVLISVKNFWIGNMRCIISLIPKVTVPELILWNLVSF